MPITIGIVFLVAGFQTAWFRTGDDRWLKLARFYGKLFLINFATGVVTGIVQEFQCGMNWSAYSRFVGDIFGAPLAIEALLAFFLESAFLGLWIFGWDRLSRRVHLATIWNVGFLGQTGLPRSAVLTWLVQRRESAAPELTVSGRREGNFRWPPIQSRSGLRA